MYDVYWFCALVGGSILVIQFVLTLLGFDGDADVDAPHVELGGGGELAPDGDLEAHAHEGIGIGQLSIRTIVAFLTFFGLGGLACETAGWSTGASLAMATGLGLCAFYGVGWLMLQLHRLRSSGNVDMRNAVGRHARVYLTVPGERSGAGKVTVAVQGRTVEVKALTSGTALPTGATCKVVQVLAEDTVLVEHTA